eukprot:m.149284 g.149284  ORF g.149284 m.149284 type:complete len:58 (-) comp17811_c0_seq1:195-368(-)
MSQFRHGHVTDTSQPCHTSQLCLWTAAYSQCVYTTARCTFMIEQGSWTHSHTQAVMH